MGTSSLIKKSCLYGKKCKGVFASISTCTHNAGVTSADIKELPGMSV